MQNVGTVLYNVLASSERDLIDVFELYEPTVTTLTPANAALRVASTSVYFDSQEYVRQYITRGDVSRYVDGKFNTVSVTLSNVDRTMSQFIADAGSLEGYRLVVRTISRRVSDDSLVLFVGRCEKAYSVGQAQVQINAKQDLGAIENKLPYRIVGNKCPLQFKGYECLGGFGRTPADYTAEYQAATTCNKTFEQCDEYGHLEFIQAFRFNPVNGNFRVNQARGGAGGAFLGLLGLGNRRVTKQWTSTQDSAFGKPIPLGYGRTQIELAPIIHADTGEYLAGQWIIGEGELAALTNVRPVSSGWATTFQAYAEHLGTYGDDPDQLPAGFFTSNGYMHSHTAYIEATVLGSNPDTGDPAPSIVGVVSWGMPLAYWFGNNSYNWTDNPVAHLYELLTEKRGLSYSVDWIDGDTYDASLSYCALPLKDTTGCDDIYISTDAGTPGTDYKRYNSTGLYNAYFFKWVLNNTGVDLPCTQEADVTTYNPTSPPTVTPTTRYRRRYTANFHIKEQITVADFIFKQLLPSFRGYLKTSASGKLQICVDKPAPYSLLRAAQVATDTVLQIEDAKAWLDETLSVRYALVGVDLATSETVEIDSIEYSTAGNSVTLTASGSGVTATASGATLSGGNAITQPSGTVVISGTPSVGSTATITIDGVAITYTADANDNKSTMAAMLHVMINADTTLNRYIEARWEPESGGSFPQDTVKIYSKLGTLNLTTPLAEDHDELETVMRIHMPFSSHAFGCLTRSNILRNSFDYPLGGRQSSYNQFTINYTDAPQDFQDVELRENDYEHQALVNKTNTLTIDGSCIDNYHQADRIVQGARYRYREGDFFCSWSTAGAALLLEEGDVVCAHHDQMRGHRNKPLRLEEVKVSADHKVSIVGRLYDVAQYPEEAGARTTPLMTSVKYYGA